MKAMESLTQGARTTVRPSAAGPPRKSEVRYRPPPEIEPGSRAPVPYDLQTHLAEGLLILDLLDLGRELAANVAIPKAEAAAFEKIAVAKIRRNLHTLSQWADQFFSATNGLGDKPSLELRAIDVHEAIASIVKDLGSQRARKEIFFDLQLEASDHHVHFEPETFRELLTDLILASIKFAPNQGLIHLASYNTSPSAIVVRVCDNELGPEANGAAPGFLPFAEEDASIRSKNGESSLSLAVARSLVETYNCKLVVENPSKSTGPTFLLELETTAASADLSNRETLR